MDENTKTKLYEEKLAALPDDLKTAFYSDAVTEVVVAIGKSHGLTIDKIGELGDEIGLVMLGITPTSDFIKNIADKLGVDKEKAKLIAEDINQKVFQPIKASMRKVHGLPEETKIPAPVVNYSLPKKTPVVTMPPALQVPTPPPTPTASATYVIPMKTPVVPAPPAASVTIGETKLEFAPIPAPQIFAKKITPIDTLLDKIDSAPSAPKPKPVMDSSALQLNPPPAPSGIRTMFQDAKSFLQSKSPTQPSVSPPNLPVAPVTKPETTILNSPPKPESNSGLKQNEVQAEIENALGGKIKIGDNSIKDPYKEPID